jgi:hypothetical protein
VRKRRWGFWPWLVIVIGLLIIVVYILSETLRAG